MSQASGLFSILRAPVRIGPLILIILGWSSVFPATVSFAQNSNPGLQFAASDLSDPATNNPVTFVSPSHLILASFNKCPGLAVANGNGTVVVLVNNFVAGHPCSRANGQFSPQTLHLDTSELPVQLASADFNGDGIPDLAVLNAPANNGAIGEVEIFLGVGDGTFGGTPVARMTLPAGSLPAALAAGDVNGDGIPDLMVGYASPFDTNQNNIQFVAGHRNLAQDQSAGACPQAAYCLDSANARSMATATAGGAVSAVGIPLSVGAPAFVYALDQSHNQLDVFQNAASSSPTTPFDINSPTALSTANQPVSLALTSFSNGGQQLDAAVADFGSNLLSLFIDQNGGISPVQCSNCLTGTGPRSVFALDFDGDHKTDLAVANQTDNTVTVLRNTGSGATPFTGSPFSLLPSDAAPIGLVASDFNGDAFPDIAVLNRGTSSKPGTVTLLLNSQVALGANSLQPPGTSQHPEPIDRTADVAVLMPFGLAASQAVQVDIAAIRVTLATNGDFTTMLASGAAINLIEQSLSNTAIGTATISAANCSTDNKGVQQCAATFSNGSQPLVTIAPGQRLNFWITAQLNHNSPPANGTIIVGIIAPSDVVPDATTPTLIAGSTVTNFAAIGAFLSPGPNNFATTEKQGASKVPALQFTISAPADAAVTVSGLSFNIATANGAAPGDLADVGLVQDDGDGFVEAAEPILGTAQRPDQSGNVRFDFSSAPITVPQGTRQNFLFFYDFNNAANPPATLGPLGATYQSTLTSVNARAGSAPLSFSSPLGANNTKTLSASQGSLAVEAGPINNQVNPQPGTPQVPVLQIAMLASTVEPVNVSSITIVNTGNSDDGAVVGGGVKLFLDRNHSGQPAAGQQPLATGTLSGNRAQLILSPPLQINQQQVQQQQPTFLVVTYDLSNDAVQGGTLNSAIAGPGDIVATGASNSDIATPSLASVPIVGATNFVGGPNTGTATGFSGDNSLHASGDSVSNAGAVKIANTAGANVTISTLTLQVSNPGLFSALTMTPNHNSRAANTVTVPSTSTVFDFSTSPIVLRPGQSATFSLSASISQHPVMSASSAKLYTAMASGGAWREGTVPLVFAFGLLTLAVKSATNRRRRLMLATLAIVLIATGAVGCGGGSSRNVGGSKGGPALSSTQALNAISAASGGQAVTVSGLPASLGTIRAN